MRSKEIWKFGSSKQLIGNSSWSFQNRIIYFNTLTEIVGVRFTPIFFGRKLITCSIEFSFSHNFPAIRYFYTIAHELETRTTDETFYMLPNNDNMRRSNIERQNSDIWLSVRYEESFCLISAQKFKIRLKMVGLPNKKLNGKKTFVL